MSFIYSYFVNRSLSKLGVVETAYNLPKVVKMKAWAEYESFSPRETAVLIFTGLPAELKSNSGYIIIDNWISNSLLRMEKIALIRKLLLNLGEMEPEVAAVYASILDIVSKYSIKLPLQASLNQVIISISVFIANKAVANLDRTKANLSEQDTCVKLLICFVSAAYLAAVTKSSFEMISVSACVAAGASPHEIDKTVEIYSKIVNSSSKVIPVIENQISQFIESHDQKYLEKLTELCKRLSDRNDQNITNEDLNRSSAGSRSHDREIFYLHKKLKLKKINRTCYLNLFLMIFLFFCIKAILQIDSYLYILLGLAMFFLETCVFIWINFDYYSSSKSDAAKIIEKINMFERELEELYKKEADPGISFNIYKEAARQQTLANLK